MIPSQIVNAQCVLNDADLALCQRVFDPVAAVREITTDTAREELASRIILSFQHGVRTSAL